VWSEFVKNLFVHLFVVSALSIAGFAQAQPSQPQTVQTKPPQAPPSGKPLTIENIFAPGGITGRAPETIQWSPDSSKVSYVQRDDSGDHGELWLLDTSTGEKKVLVSEGKMAQLDPSRTNIHDEREKERLTRYHIADYVWSPDSKHLLFDSQGQLWYYSIDTGTGVQITSSSDPVDDPKFSPDGKRVVYVRRHSLYSRPVSGDEGERAVIQGDKKEKDTTKDDDILNGEVDWVYAEELSVRSNFFWSPEGHDIIFLQMDESHVPVYPIVDWIPVHPHVDFEKYPKAGDSNPLVRLAIVSSEGGKPRWLKLTDDDDVYIPRFGWIREGLAWAEVLNRKQDRMDLYFVETHSGKVRKVLTESEPDAWVEVNDNFRVLKSGDRFLWTSWRDGHTHIYLYSFNQGDPLSADAKLERQLESGDYEVLAINGIDANTNTVFFTANKDDPREQKIFSIKLDGSEMQALSTEPGQNVGLFADDGKHYVRTHSATLVPPRISACAVTQPESTHSCTKIWEGRSIAAYAPIVAKDLEFKAEDGTVLYGSLILPPKELALDRTPLIVYIYGGPAAQTVQDAWESDGTRALFHQILAKQGFAIFSVDNRGTPNRGKKFSAAIKGQFGAIELKDQLTALDQLYAQYPQFDPNRTAIWGWSNGGSMTLYAMTHSSRFKAGISGAPVTSWRDYDSIYAERYLGLPKENASAYDDSMVRAASSLSGTLLLIHGTSDDNVHFQNSIQMIDSLIHAEKQFRLMIYPGKTHGVTGSAERIHLYHMMEDFWNGQLRWELVNLNPTE
jgi:dipeptidyl-peptidase 4